MSERVAWRAPPTGAPGTGVGVLWLAVAALAGVGAGFLALGSTYRLLLAAAALVVLAVLVLSLVRPLRAGQLVVVAVFSGLVYLAISPLAPGDVRGAALLVGILFAGGMLSREDLRAEQVRRFAVPLLLLLAAFALFALAGSLRGLEWVAVRGDLVPMAFLLAFFPVAASLRDDRAVRAVSAAALVGVAVLAGVLVTEYLTNLRLDFGTVTRFAKLIPDEGVGGGPRVRPLGGQGALVPVLLVAALALVRGGRAARGHAAAGVVLGMLAALGLLVMYTRSLLIAAPVAVMLYLLLVSRDRTRLIRTLAAGALLLALTGLVVSLASGQSPGRILDGLGRRFSDITSDVSYRQRAAENRAALDVFAERPWLGLGLGADVEVAELAGRQDPPGFFHTTYVGLLVKTGVLGTAAFVGFMLLVLFRAAREAVARAGPPRHLLAVAAAGLAALLLASVSEPYVVSDSGYLYVALVAALTGYYETRPRVSPSRSA